MIPSTRNLSYFTKIFSAIFPIYLSKIWQILKQNYEILAKNIVKLKYLLNTRKLSNNNSIVILKQYKGRGVVIMNRSAYLGKRFTLLNTSQFNKLAKDPMHATGRKIQRVPIGSAPSKFYETAKIYKLSANDTIN